MHTLEQVASRPSAWDSPNNYLGTPLNEFRNQYVVLCRNRDSGLLTNHNFETALSMLGGESEDVQIDRFNHWACGWWEALTVTQKKQTEGQAIVDKLEQHPVLNEDDFSEKEWNAAQEYWTNLSVKERVELCQQAKISVFAARHDYIPQAEHGIFKFRAACVTYSAWRTRHDERALTREEIIQAAILLQLYYRQHIKEGRPS